MPNPFLAAAIYFAVGVLVVRFAKRAYLNPDTTLERWYSELPRKNWFRNLLRVFSVVWTFGGMLMILAGITELPFLAKVRGFSFSMVLVGTAVVGTALFLARSRRSTQSQR